MRLTHGLSKTRSYRAWGAMKMRCTNPNSPVWSHYGGRGIAFDPAWETFEGFYLDMGDCPPRLSLDRIDNDGPYGASNCRWASQSTQNGNRGKRRGCTSKYIGVFFDKQKRMWVSKITVEGVIEKLGIFKSEAEAALKYNEAAARIGRKQNIMDEVI